MGVVYLAYCGSWQLSLHVPCFCAFYIFNTTPNPTSSSFFQNVFVLVYCIFLKQEYMCVHACVHACVCECVHECVFVCLVSQVQSSRFIGAVKT